MASVDTRVRSAIASADAAREAVEYLAIEIDGLVDETRRQAEETYMTRAERWSIVGIGPYGLWFGDVVTDDAEIAATHAVTLRQARNIRYWYGRKGGVSSLAAFGPCGPDVDKCRIGAPIERAFLLDVKSILGCSPEAVSAFKAVTSHDR